MLRSCEEELRHELRKTGGKRWGDEEERGEGGEQKIEPSANRLCRNTACWGHWRWRGKRRGRGRETVSAGVPQTDDKHCNPWREKQENEDVTGVLISCPHSHSCSKTLQRFQFTHTCTHTCPYRPGHTFIKGPVVLRSSAAALWHAGLQWFAVIKQPPVKFKQVFCNSLIHGQGDGLKWDCRVWSIKLIRRFEEGSLSRIPLFLQSDPGWKWELIRKRGSCCPVLMCSAVCVALRLTALSGSGQSCTKSPFIPVWLIWVHTSGGRWLKKLGRTGGKPTHRVILVHLTAYFNFMFNGK